MDFPYATQVETALQALAALSAATFLVSLVAIPLLIGRLPRDYFSAARKPRTGPAGWPNPLTVLLTVIRNVFGLLLLAAGIAMLFLPGQGIITIIIGIALMSLPRKHQLLTWLTGPETVRNSLDWLRRKMDKEPFLW